MAHDGCPTKFIEPSASSLFARIPDLQPQLQPQDIPSSCLTYASLQECSVPSPAYQPPSKLSLVPTHCHGIFLYGN